MKLNDKLLPINYYPKRRNFYNQRFNERTNYAEMRHYLQSGFKLVITDITTGKNVTKQKLIDAYIMLVRDDLTNKNDNQIIEMIKQTKGKSIHAIKRAEMAKMNRKAAKVISDESLIKPITNDAVTLRNCLSCTQSFGSISPFNRVCKQCKDNPTYHVAN